MGVPAPEPPSASSRRRTLIAGAVIVAAVWAAYANTLQVPFVFDDVPTIVENATIRRLWPPGDVLWPDAPGGLTTSGRPLVNLSFALNYAVGGENVIGYHVINTLIHLGAALLLFGVIRRTLIRVARAVPDGAVGAPAGGPRNAGASADQLTWLALGLALLWALHPLQTESVTYIVQRAESLAGFWFLLALYAFIRATGDGCAGNTTGPSRRNGYAVVSVIACACAMATKEVAVSAPLIVLLYDALFCAGSVRAALAARRGYYLALASTWLLLAVLVVSTDSRGATAGFSAGVSPWEYALTQCRAIVLYLARAIWPQGLVFDHGTATVRSLLDVIPQAAGMLAAFASAVWALTRGLTRQATPGFLPGAAVVGFLAVSFFALLAPSSSVVPVVTQTAAEHRMYLPLAPLVVGVGLGVNRLFGRRATVLLLAAAGCLGVATAFRNHDYRSEVSLWADTAEKLPSNARAHNNLGQALYRAGDKLAAEQRYRRALALRHDYPEPHYNLGVALADRGDLTAAVEHYRTALQLQPAYPEAENNLANALVRLGRADEALGHYATALRTKPDFAEAENNWGNALLGLGRVDEAVAHFGKALSLQPRYAEAHYNLGNALAAIGRMEEALQQYRRALDVQPEYAAAQVNAGNALLALGRAGEALAAYEAAIGQDPALIEARINAGLLLIDLEKHEEAVRHLSEAVRRGAASASVRKALGYALAQTGRIREAIAEYEACLRENPGDPDAVEALRQLRR